MLLETVSATTSRRVVRLVELAKGGDLGAIKELFDRVHGRSQPIHDREAPQDRSDRQGGARRIPTGTHHGVNTARMPASDDVTEGRQNAANRGVPLPAIEGRPAEVAFEHLKKSSASPTSRWRAIRHPWKRCRVFALLFMENLD